MTRAAEAVILHTSDGPASFYRAAGVTMHREGSADVLRGNDRRASQAQYPGRPAGLSRAPQQGPQPDRLPRRGHEALAVRTPGEDAGAGL